MGVPSIFLHAVHSIAPALGMALLLPLLMRIGKRRSRVRLRTEILVLAGLGVLCVVLGLWLWGADGRIATYGLLALVLGSAQFWLARP